MKPVLLQSMVYGAQAIGHIERDHTKSHVFMHFIQEEGSGSEADLIDDMIAAWYDGFDTAKRAAERRISSGPMIQNIKTDDALEFRDQIYASFGHSEYSVSSYGIAVDGKLGGKLFAGSRRTDSVTKYIPYLFTGMDKAAQDIYLENLRHMHEETGLIIRNLERLRNEKN